MTELGFDILPGDHPIVPVMIGDAARAARLADGLIRRGVYAVGFSYPVVPQGTARIRTQMSAAHTAADIDFALDQFVAARSELSSGGSSPVNRGRSPRRYLLVEQGEVLLGHTAGLRELAADGDARCRRAPSASMPSVVLTAGFQGESAARWPRRRPPACRGWRSRVQKLLPGIGPQ